MQTAPSTVTNPAQLANAALVDALGINLPDAIWMTGDDLCDCTYQRVCQFTNPYLAETHELRFCCLWAELAKDYPQFVRTIPAFWNYNIHEWETQPREWDSTETDMPTDIWYRQLARKTGRPLAEIREEYQHRKDEKPRAVAESRTVQPTQEQLDHALRARLTITGWLS